MRRRLQRNDLAGMSESEQNEKAICAEGALARGTRAQQGEEGIPTEA